MKTIAVLNFSGNVGKSTVARHLLAPRMGNARVIAVESINSDEGDSEAVRGRQFGDLMEAIAVEDGNVVVDVGASNVEEFLGQMKQYRGSHEDIDFFVVPVVPKNKQIRDTISTITALAEEVGEWNEMIAATFGAISDVLKASGSSAELVSPITAYPDFEHLEFKGQQNHEYLGPFLQAMKKLADQQREALPKAG